MERKFEGYRKYLFVGIIVIAIGVTFSASLEDSTGSLGTVLIAIGGLLLIIAMSKKQKEDKERNNT